jgi:uncharacterized protein (DUF2147 family)
MNKIIFFLFFSFFLFSASVNANESSIFGKWKTVDDDSGKVKSIVELYEDSGKLYGRILKLFPEPGKDPDPVCDLCPGDRKDQKIIGMVIIDGLTRDGNKWSDGEVLDPNNGKLYDCKIWLEGEKLKIRGYLLFFFRTQTWYRFDQAEG